MGVVGISSIPQRQKLKQDVATSIKSSDVPDRVEDEVVILVVALDEVTVQQLLRVEDGQEGVDQERTHVYVEQADFLEMH